jgi:hypothetical protein
MMQTIKEAVYEWLEDSEDPKRSLEQYGCGSGVVGSLVYYTDTIKFYEDYRREISELLQNLIESTGSPVHELFGDKWDSDDPLANECNNQNLLAWFAFEETASIMLDSDEYPKFIVTTGDEDEDEFDNLDEAKDFAAQLYQDYVGNPVTIKITNSVTDEILHEINSPIIEVNE